MLPAEYYGNSFVRERISDYFGGPLPGKATAVFFTAGTESEPHTHERHPLEEVPGWMRHGAELNRSLWDRRSLIAHLDVEYVNFDNPGRAYLEEERAFALQNPVVLAVDSFLSSFGIRRLHLLTGRGHHFVWSIKQNSDAFSRLAELGRPSASLERLYATLRAPTGERVQSSLAWAFAGLGMVVEYLAHSVKAEAAGNCELPVELGAIEIGGGGHEREMISVDITEYGDPLCSRTIRSPFSIYLKLSQSHILDSDDAATPHPLWFVVPLADMEPAEALQMRHDPASVIQLARRSNTLIPDASEAMENLIDAYRLSSLAQFHQEYYSDEHDAPATWPETYDRTPLEMLPGCARLILERPNDLLLRPGCVQRVVRVMLALGWHPRHIAGLIRSKYERDYGWGSQWEGFDPATRADFYARVFSGMFFTGLDNLEDFNCQSAREEGLCLVENCTANLQDFQKLLLDRRNHERLASRSVHRVFLPEEHL
jgi:hypothetical protein